MPIRPENRRLYPKHWPEIRAAILERAEHRCEEPGCGVRNHALGYRDAESAFHEIDAAALHNMVPDVDGMKPIRIVLTIAHLNHDPTDNRPENLAALCQLHHNRHDAEHRRANAARTRAAKRGGRQSALFQEPS